MLPLLCSLHRKCPTMRRPLSTVSFSTLPALQWRHCDIRRERRTRLSMTPWGGAGSSCSGRSRTRGSRSCLCGLSCRLSLAAAGSRAPRTARACRCRCLRLRCGCLRFPSCVALVALLFSSRGPRGLALVARSSLSWPSWPCSSALVYLVSSSAPPLDGPRISRTVV